MNTHTTLSAKGQVVIPKATRDRLRIRPGQKFEVVETAEGVLLKRLPVGGRVSFEDGMARIREVAGRRKRPTVSIDEMNEAIREGWTRAAQHSDRAGN